MVTLTKKSRVSLFKHHAVCTCCPQPRMVHRPRIGAPWRHLTGTPASTFHVHRSSSSSDCDGPRHHYSTLRRSKWANVESDFDLWTQACRLELSPHAMSQKVAITSSGEDPFRPEPGVATFAEITEEGDSFVELRACEDTWCAFEASTSRDIYAEQMGY